MKCMKDERPEIQYTTINEQPHMTKCANDELVENTSL